MTESSLYKRLKRHLPQAHFTRLENSISSGVPDVYVTMTTSMWWELKVLQGLTIGVRPLQFIWAKRNYDAGARNLFFVWAEDNDVCFISYSTLRIQEIASKDSKAIRFKVKGKEDFRVSFGHLQSIFNMV